MLDSFSLSQYKTDYGTSVSPHAEDFSFKKHPDWLLGPCSFVVSAYQGSFPGVKLLGREADHARPSIAEVKNEWSYLPPLPYTPPWCVEGQLYLFRAREFCMVSSYIFPCQKTANYSKYVKDAFTAELIYHVWKNTLRNDGFKMLKQTHAFGFRYRQIKKKKLNINLVRIKWPKQCCRYSD
jgi:hypothetical protein